MSSLPPRVTVQRTFPDRLVAGYESFLDGRFAQESERYRKLAEIGQRPRIMLIGCCDSRVAPETVFDAGPGELFVVRNVANLIPPYTPNDEHHGTSAALEFGVMGLRVEHIVVLGHAQCGGVRAFVENEVDPYTRPLSPGDFIGQWMKLIAPAYEKAGPPPQDDTAALGDFCERLALESIRQSIANLRSFPCVRTLEERGMLALHGAYFGVMDGLLRVWNEASDTFAPVSSPRHALQAQSLKEPRF